MDSTFSNSYTTRRKVLVVDDEFVNRQLLGMIVGEEYEVIFAENGREALDLIRENRETLSLVMLDLIMPVMDGFELLELLHGDEELRRIPVIVLTSEKSAEVRSLKLGAADFITKPYDMPEVILARVARIIELSEGRSLIRATEKDELTGLYTGSFFYEYAQKLELYHPEWDMDAVVIDIDRFHMINDLYGREFGDQLLRLLARKIQQLLAGAEGIACRMEADMFYVYCLHRDNYDETLQSIQKGLSGVAKTVHIRLRVGIHPKIDQKLEIERRFDRAKTACNMLRGNFSKSTMLYDTDLHRSELYKEQLLNDIRKGLSQKQFKAFFQPKYNIRGDKPVLSSAETLIRWEHPEFGMVSPGDFIPLFENNGLIQMVDYYIWREAAAYIRRWKDEFGRFFPVSVNVSRADIYDPELENKLVGLLEEYDLPPEVMMLEITESAYTQDSDQIIATLDRLRARGFLIEMDDFGSGYSSLNSLFLLPIDIIKLDMKFIQGINEQNKGLRLIKLILDIAEYLSAPVVAEGVETEEQYRILKDAGCDVIQGYYFSRPLPADQYKKLLGEV